MRQIIIVAHNLRSCHNVGAILRTAEGLGLEEVFLTGYTPYPIEDDDKRLPHIANKLAKQINKTALGAELKQKWRHCNDFETAKQILASWGYTIVALEQTINSIDLKDLVVPDKIALVVGREVEGIEPDVVNQCDLVVEIPMFGHKESFNVVQAAAMALYHCRFH